AVMTSPFSAAPGVRDPLTCETRLRWESPEIDVTGVPEPPTRSSRFRDESPAIHSMAAPGLVVVPGDVLIWTPNTLSVYGPYAFLAYCWSLGDRSKFQSTQKPLVVNPRLFGTIFARFTLPGKVTAILAESSHGGAIRQQPGRWT